jgi:hypothetical protein
MNEITIHGNLTDEPTRRYSPSGVPVVSFSVAVNGRRFNRQTNRWVDKAPVFHQVVAFNGLPSRPAHPRLSADQVSTRQPPRSASTFWRCWRPSLLTPSATILSPQPRPVGDQLSNAVRGSVSGSGTHSVTRGSRSADGGMVSRNMVERAAILA